MVEDLWRIQGSTVKCEIITPHWSWVPCFSVLYVSLFVRCIVCVCMCVCPQRVDTDSIQYAKHTVTHQTAQRSWNITEETVWWYIHVIPASFLLITYSVPDILCIYKTCLFNSVYVLKERAGRELWGTGLFMQKHIHPVHLSSYRSHLHCSFSDLSLWCLVTSCKL